jgi:hypothetical protein
MTFGCKIALVICAFPFMVAGVAWGLLYILFNLIRDDFVCEPRGTLNVQGKGEMEVWLVKSAQENPWKILHVFL